MTLIFTFPFQFMHTVILSPCRTLSPLVLIRFSFLFTSKDGKQAKAAGVYSKHPSRGILGRMM